MCITIIRLLEITRSSCFSPYETNPDDCTSCRECLYRDVDIGVHYQFISIVRGWETIFFQTDSMDL